jgi:hypothetical protein
MADLRTAMSTERGRRISDGWHAEDIPRHCAFFFCDRSDERLCIAIECFEPGARNRMGRLRK